jgi:hypothetical protein
LEYNPVFQHLSAIFENEDEFIDRTKELAKCLHHCSDHPKIKTGQLFVCLFSGFEWDGFKTDGIGLFKMENVSRFYQVELQDGAFQLYWQDGLDLGKFEKGCLVYKAMKDEGFVVQLMDRQSGDEARYWKDDFLQIKPRKDDFNQTTHFLKQTKQFIQSHVVEELDFSTTDQVALLEKSQQYFKTNERFEADAFETLVLEDERLIKSFREQREALFDDPHSWEEGFEISQTAVKKQQKIFRSVLKLDKNFHVYIHGNHEMIEQGVDPDGRKFYKLYYQDEQFD